MVDKDFTQEEIQEKWHDEIAPGIDKLREWVNGAAEMSPQSGSARFGDDRCTKPFNQSTAFWASMSSASDHLYALKVLVWDTQVHNVFAPYTLVRASIEASSMAVWLLNSKGRDERVLRALRWFAQNYRDACRATGYEEKVEAKLRKIEQVATARSLDPKTATSRYSVTEVVEDADRLFPGVLRVWQLFSGMAHSRLWASLLLSNTEELANDQDMKIVKMTSGSEQILLATQAALANACKAAHLWQWTALS